MSKRDAHTLGSSIESGEIPCADVGIRHSSTHICCHVVLLLPWLSKLSVWLILVTALIYNLFRKRAAILLGGISCEVWWEYVSWGQGHPISSSWLPKWQLWFLVTECSLTVFRVRGLTLENRTGSDVLRMGGVEAGLLYPLKIASGYYDPLPVLLDSEIVTQFSGRL